MGAASIQQMADRVSGLMEERLRVAGSGLAAKMGKAGRSLPRQVRAAGERLARASMMAQNPRLVIQVDEAQVAEDYDTCLKHLLKVNVWDRRKGRLIGLTISVLGILVVVAALAGGFAYWRGLM